MGNPCYKGAEFERATCKRLSEWWSDGKRDDIFWRTATSGGRATQRTKSGKQTYGQYGDLQAVDPVGKPLLQLICFELKCGYPSVSVGDLLDTVNGGKVWHEWIGKARKSAEGARSPYWMIVFKKGRRQPMVIYPQELHEELQWARGGRGLTRLRTSGWFACPGVALADALVVTPLEDFLLTVFPKDVRKAVVGRMKSCGIV